MAKPQGRRPGALRIDRIDHLVLTVRDVDETVEFHVCVLGMEPVMFEDGRRALAFGRQKINLHQAGHEFEPKSAIPTPGSADICLVTTGPIEDALAQLAADDVAIEEGPVARTGALGPMKSLTGNWARRFSTLSRTLLKNARTSGSAKRLACWSEDRRSKAASLGTKMVKGPGPPRVSTRPARDSIPLTNLLY